jgi:tetratricopeptide (TPR) repeat protein
MSPDERQARESKAERALRRGELAAALAHFRDIALAFPDDAALAARIADLEASVSPQERVPRIPITTEPSGVFRSPMHEAEALAARGDFGGAIGVYRKLLAANPELDLVKERLAELFQLAQASASPKQSVSREQVLEHLLGRIGSRRRS